MAFGKVVVRSESGDYTEYDLTRPVTSVGRQAGNDIVLNTSAVSRYHAQLVVTEGEVFLVDLGTVNGTFINDAQLEAGGRVALANGDVIMLGDMMLTFISPNPPARFDITLTPSMKTTRADDVPFVLIVDELHQVVAPGARLRLRVLIESQSSAELMLNLTLDGLPNGWAKSNRRELLLSPGEQGEAVVSILPPPASTTRPGRYALTIRVALKDDPNVALEVIREIDVVGYSGMALAAQAEGRGGPYIIHVHNQGNMPLELVLEGFDRQRFLSYAFRPNHLQIGPGQTAQAGLRVRPRRRGRPGTVQFAVVARSLNQASFRAPLPLTYDASERPGLALAALPLLLGSLLLALLLAVGAVLLVGPDRLGLPSGSGGEASGLDTEPVTVPTGVPPTATLISTITPSVRPTPSVTVMKPVISGVQATDASGVIEGSVVYRTVGTIILDWTALSLEAGDTYELFVSPDPVFQGTLVAAFGVEEAGGVVGVPIESLEAGPRYLSLVIRNRQGDVLVTQQLAEIKVIRANCRFEVDAPAAYLQPEEGAALAPEVGTGRVTVVGRTAGSDWARVSYETPAGEAAEGWMPADEVTCQSVKLDQFVVLDADGRLSVQP